MGKSSKKPKFDTTPTSIPTTKKVKEVKKGRRGVDEVLDDLAGPRKDKVEVQLVSLNMEKAKRMMKNFIESPREKKEEAGSADFEGEIAATSVVLLTKESKKGKRGNDDKTEKQECSKKKKIELEKVVQSNKKVKKLKTSFIDSRRKKMDESSDFEIEVDTTHISVPLKEKVKKGKRISDEDHDKQPRYEMEKIEVEQLTLVKENIKKVKNSLIEETPLEKEGESKSLKFEGEVAPGTFMVSQTKASKRVKWENEDEPEKQAIFKKQKIEVELGQSNKKVKKFKKALTEPMGKKMDETCSLGFEEEDPDDDAENKRTCTISENESKSLAEQDDKSAAKRLFVGNLSPEIVKDDLLEFFNEAGKVIEVQLAANGDGSFRGFGHVEFATAEDAQRALGMNYQLLLGRRVMIDFAVEKGSNNAPKGKVLQDSAHCIYVKGFGKSLGEDQIRNSLKEHFGSCGDIIRVSIPQDNKTGRSKGFAYILFNHQVTVSKALELNGTALGSYTLTVEQPAPKGGAFNGAYRGSRGSRGRSADHGEDGGGRGKGRRRTGAPYNSATTASKAKKTIFSDSD